jgi:hypothetical protein
MIDYQQFCQIQQLHHQEGLHVAQIAAALALDPRTVAYWLAQDHYRRKRATPRASKLDSFKADIVRLLDKSPYSAAQVWQRLREQGFEGGYSIVKA